MKSAEEALIAQNLLSKVAMGDQFLKVPYLIFMFLSRYNDHIRMLSACFCSHALFSIIFNSSLLFIKEKLFASLFFTVRCWLEKS